MSDDDTYRFYDDLIKQENDIDWRVWADDLYTTLDELAKATALTAPPGIDLSVLARYREARDR